MRDNPRAPKKRPRKKKAGRRERPRFEPDAHRGQVETLAALGMPHEQIVLLFIDPATGKPITERVLRKHFQVELDRGSVNANAKVAKSLWEKATSGEPGSVSAGIWWEKTRGGRAGKPPGPEVDPETGVLL